MGYVAVAEFDDLTEGVPKVVTVNGRELGVIRWQDEVFAVRNICPHQYAPVCSGYTMSMIVADGCGGIAVDRDRPVLLCPWHQWEFDVRTGEVVIGEENYRLKTYSVAVENGAVMVDVGGAAKDGDA